MNRKQLGILLVLVLVVGGAGLLLRHRDDSSWQSGNPALGNKLLDKLPINDIAQVTITERTNVLNLVKRDDLWRVQERNNYPADFTQISQLLLKLRDLKVVQSDTVGASQLPQLQLAPPGAGSNSATQIEFKDQKGAALKQTVLLGKNHMQKPARGGGDEMGDGGFPDGRWVATGPSPSTVALVSETLSEVEARPEQWLDKSFFKVEKAKSVEVTFPIATNSWKLTRDTESGGWKLADAKPGEQLDSSRISALSSPLSSPTFDDVVTSLTPEQVASGKPTVVKIETFDHFNYTVNVSQKTNDNYLLTVSVNAQLSKERAAGKDEKPDEKTKLDKEFKDAQQKLQDKLKQEQAFEKWVYLVSTWTVDPVLKERSQLMVDKKEEAKKAAATDGRTAEPKIVEPPSASPE